MHSRINGDDYQQRTRDWRLRTYRDCRDRNLRDERLLHVRDTVRCLNLYPPEVKIEKIYSTEGLNTIFHLLIHINPKFAQDPSNYGLWKMTESMA